MDRLTIPIDPASVRLTGADIAGWYAGEAAVAGVLTAGPARVVNVMVARGMVRASVDRWCGGGAIKVGAPSIFVCLTGRMQTQTGPLGPFDSVRCEASTRLTGDGSGLLIRLLDAAVTYSLCRMGVSVIP